MTLSFQLDGEVLLFEPGAGSLFLLNAAAGLVWLCLEEGLDRHEAAAQLAAAADIPLSQALDDCDAIIAQWEQLELSTQLPSQVGPGEPAIPAAWPDPAAPPSTSADDECLQRTYQIADFRFVLRSGRSEAEQGVHAFLRYLEVTPSDAPVQLLELTNAGEAWQLCLAGAVIDRTRREDGLLPMMHRCVLVAAVRGSRAAAALHAGVMAYGDATILLAGISGAGKSTLSAALMANGFGYCGDDMALLSSPPVRVRGVPTRLRLLEESWPLIRPLWPELAKVPAHRRHDGRMVSYFVPAGFSPPQRLVDGTRAELLIFPQYVENTPVSLEPLSRGQALVLLTEAGYNFSEILTEQLVRDFIDWLAELDSYRLEYSSLDDATAAIKSLVIDDTPGKAKA